MFVIFNVVSSIQYLMLDIFKMNITSNIQLLTSKMMMMILNLFVCLTLKAWFTMLMFRIRNAQMWNCNSILMRSNLIFSNYLIQKHFPFKNVFHSNSSIGITIITFNSNLLHCLYIFLLLKIHFFKIESKVQWSVCIFLKLT